MFNPIDMYSEIVTFSFCPMISIKCCILNINAFNVLEQPRYSVIYVLCLPCVNVINPINNLHFSFISRTKSYPLAVYWESPWNRMKPLTFQTHHQKVTLWLVTLAPARKREVSSTKFLVSGLEIVYSPRGISIHHESSSFHI